MFDTLSARGQILYMLAKTLGARVTSGKRTVAENASVGGAPSSLHLTGDAIDISLDSPAIAVAVLGLFAKGGVHQKGTAAHYHFEATDLTLPLFLGTMVFVSKVVK